MIEESSDHESPESNVIDDCIYLNIFELGDVKFLFNIEDTTTFPTWATERKVQAYLEKHFAQNIQGLFETMYRRMRERKRQATQAKYILHE